MEILHKSRRVLAYAGLCSDIIVKIHILRIPRAFIRIGYVSTLGLCLILNVRSCFANEHSFIAILLPVGVVISCVSMILIYVNLALKTQTITRLLDYLQHFIDSSTVFHTIVEFRGNMTTHNYDILLFLVEFLSEL